MPIAIYILIGFIHISCKSLFQDVEQSNFGQLISLGVVQNAMGLYHYSTLNGFFIPDYQPDTFQETLAQAEKTLLTKPNDPESITIIAISLLRDQNPEGALALIRNQKTHTFKMTILEAISLSMMEQYPEAIQKLSSQNQDPLIRLNQGILKMKSGQFTNAISDFQSVTDNNSVQEIAFLFKGQAEYALRKFKEAETSFQEVLKINRDNSLAMLNLAQLYRYGLRDSKKAIQYYKKVLNGYYPKTIKQQAEQELNVYLKSLDN